MSCPPVCCFLLGDCTEATQFNQNVRTRSRRKDSSDRALGWWWRRSVHNHLPDRSDGRRGGEARTHGRFINAPLPERPSEQINHQDVVISDTFMNSEMIETASCLRV